MEIDLITSDLLHLASLRQAMELMTAPVLPTEVAAGCAKLTHRINCLTYLSG